MAQRRARRRRRPGTGGLFQRRSDGLWIAQVTRGPRGARQVVRRYAPTPEEAEELLDQLRAGYGVADRTTTVGDYLRAWLTANEQRLRPSTQRTYRSMVTRHIVPSIGAIRLVDLAPDHVEQMIGAARLAPSGRRHVLALLARVLATAERRRLVARNVARLVDPPRVPAPDRPALTPDEARRILAAVRGNRLEALYVLALATGLRMGELLGLTWADVDRDAGTITVRHALVRHRGTYRLDEPKTRRSVRTIALPGVARQALVEHWAHQIEERIAAGSPTSAGLVFVTPAGRPISGGWLSHRWRRIATAAGLDLRFHDLRHAQASLLVALGVHPRVVAERLGHATTAMAMDRYAHIDLALDRDAAARLDEVLG